MGGIYSIGIARLKDQNTLIRSSRMNCDRAIISAPIQSNAAGMIGQHIKRNARVSQGKEIFNLVRQMSIRLVSLIANGF